MSSEASRNEIEVMDHEFDEQSRGAIALSSATTRNAWFSRPTTSWPMRNVASRKPEVLRLTGRGAPQAVPGAQETGWCR